MRIDTVTAPNPGPYTLDGTRSYVLGGEAVVDPGPSIAAHVDALLAAAPHLTTIFVTHRHADHAPAAAALRSRTGARVVAPAGIEPQPDVPLRDGDVFPIGEETLEAIATPGHTGEHFCFLSSAGDLFTGDTILGEGTTTIFPPDGDMAAYIDSLRKLRGREPRAIYPGHGPVRRDAAAWIDYYIAHRLEREAQVVAALRLGPATPAALRERIYPGLDPALHAAATLQMEAHLAKLERDGKAVRTGSTWSSA
ncbi:MAG: MBL fold metallo-hydrolase [Thermoanaerobaculia bacterium]